MSALPARRCSAASAGSASCIDSSTWGWRSWKAATARGASVAPPLWNEISRRRPPRRPARAASSSSAESMRARIASAWPTSTRPASVSRTPRRPRSTSWVPVSRSSAATCWEIADWVKLSASAAAENEPQEATSRRTRMRRTSSIRTAYRSPKMSSFGLMPVLCDPQDRMSRRSWLLLGVLSALWGALLPVHQGRARGRHVADGDRLRAHRARGAGAAAARRPRRRARRPARATSGRSWCSPSSRWAARCC